MSSSTRLGRLRHSEPCLHAGGPALSPSPSDPGSLEGAAEGASLAWSWASVPPLLLPFSWKFCLSSFWSQKIRVTSWVQKEGS